MDNRVKEFGILVAGANSDQTNMKQPDEDDVLALFGLQIRVNKTFLSDDEIQLLQTIDKKIAQLEYAKILNIPENEQILRDLILPYNKNNRNRQEEHNPNKERTEQRQQRREEQNYQKEAAVGGQNLQKYNKEKKQQGDYQGKKNQEEQKRNDDESFTNNKKKFQSFNGEDKSKPKNTFYNNRNNDNNNNNNKNSNFPQVNHRQVPITPNQFPIPDYERYSRVSGWFFMDHSQQMLTSHSLINSNEFAPWNFLFKLWKMTEACQSEMKPETKLDLLGLTNERLKQEMKMLQKMPQNLTNNNIFFSDNPSAFLLSKTPSNSVAISTCNSQTAVYSPFDFRVIFTECDGYDNFRALSFGLVFNTLALQLKLNEPIFYLIQNNEIPFSIRMTLYHILCMRLQYKIQKKEIAHNLIYIFKSNQMTKDILMKLISLFSKSNISQEINFDQLAQNSLHIITYQEISHDNSKVITCEPQQGQQPVCGLFLDCTPRECGVNLYFKTEKYQSCCQAYQKLGKEQIPSV